MKGIEAARGKHRPLKPRLWCCLSCCLRVHQRPRSHCGERTELRGQRSVSEAQSTSDSSASPDTSRLRAHTHTPRQSLVLSPGCQTDTRLATRLTPLIHAALEHMKTSGNISGFPCTRVQFSSLRTGQKTFPQLSSFKQSVLLQLDPKYIFSSRHSRGTRTLANKKSTKIVKT